MRKKALRKKPLEKSPSPLLLRNYILLVQLSRCQFDIDLGISAYIIPSVTKLQLEYQLAFIIGIVVCQMIKDLS